MSFTVKMCIYGKKRGEVHFMNVLPLCLIILNKSVYTIPALPRTMSMV